MYKFLAFLFLIGGLLGYALFSFYSAYSDCYAASLQVRDAYADIIEDCDEITAVSVKTGSLALKYLKEGRLYVNKLEKRAERIHLPKSVSQLAEDCKAIYSTMRQVITLLNNDLKAYNDYHLKDIELQLKKIRKDLKIDSRRYNRAVKNYNETLKKPLPKFWNFLLDYKPAEYFK